MSSLSQERIWESLSSSANLHPAFVWRNSGHTVVLSDACDKFPIIPFYNDARKGLVSSILKNKSSMDNRYRWQGASATDMRLSWRFVSIMRSMIFAFRM